MREFICINCGNRAYFETDVEVLKITDPTPAGLIIEDAEIDDANYSDEMLRSNLIDILDYVQQQSIQTLQFNIEANRYFNTYISCARCKSMQVTPPFSNWQPAQLWPSLDEELNQNLTEYLKLRKEQNNGNHLPVLWKQQEVFNTALVPCHL